MRRRRTKSPWYVSLSHKNLKFYNMFFNISFVLFGEFFIVKFTHFIAGFRRDQGFYDYKRISDQRTAEADEEPQGKLTRLSHLKVQVRG